MNLLLTRIPLPVAALLATAAVLAACGGRDDNSNAQPVASNYSPDDVRSLAALAAALPQITSERTGLAVFLMSGDLIDQSHVFTDPAWTSGAQACSKSGTRTLSVTKSMWRIGLGVGDKLSAVYSNCDYGDGYVFDGTYAVIAANDMRLLSNDEYDLRFTAEMSNLSATDGTVASRATGSASVAVNVKGDALSFRLSIPSGGTLSVDSAGTNFKYADSASLALVGDVTPGIASAKLDGLVTVTTTDTRFKTVAMTLSTSQELSGPSDTAFTPTSGAIAVQASVLPTFDKAFSGTATINGSTLSINADSDGNGATDTSLNTTWASLMQSIPGGIRLTEAALPGANKAFTVAPGPREAMALRKSLGTR